MRNNDPPGHSIDTTSANHGNVISQRQFELRQGTLANNLYIFCHTRDLDPLNDDLECIEILREVMQNALIPNQYWALIKALHHYQELDSSIQILDALRRMEELHYSKEYYPSDFTAVLKRFKKVLNEHGVDIPYERLLTKVTFRWQTLHAVSSN